MRRASRQGLGQVFAVPLVLLVTTIAGLVLGLAGDGLPDWAAWALLSLPILAVLRAWQNRS